MQTKTRTCFERGRRNGNGTGKRSEGVCEDDEERAKEMGEESNELNKGDRPAVK